MKKFKFGLQKVLDYRQTLEDIRLAELAGIQAEYEAESQRLLRMSEAREEFKSRMREMLASGDPEYIRQANAYLHDLTERVLLQKSALDEIAARKDAKTAEVVDASKDRKALERLREYKVVEHRQDTLRHEQKFLDEVASVRHTRTGDVRAA
jgi:flagellar FliJ protein